MPNSVDEWIVELKKRDIADVIAMKGQHQPTSSKIAAEIVWHEIEEKKIQVLKEQEFQRNLELKKYESSLWGLWKMCDWQQRLGMIFAYIGVFFIGFTAAQFEPVRRFTQAAKDLIR